MERRSAPLKCHCINRGYDMKVRQASQKPANSDLCEMNPVFEISNENLTLSLRVSLIFLDPTHD